VLRVATVSFYLSKCGHFILCLLISGQGRNLAGTYPHVQGKRTTWGWRGGLPVSG
jgi:hypothetical protein